jgi:alpha-glucosidase (family GH31 glycosyl hydrolase)
MIGGNAYFRFPSSKLVSWFFHRLVIPVLERRLRNGSEYPEEEALGLSDVPAFLEKSVLFGYPTPELIIRWTQANLFLGVMQFSLAPWDFGEEANRICRQYAELHLEFVPILEKYARQAVETGDPIIRPVFWLAPEDKAALTCEDQFLVGEEILVAPVLHPRQRSRTVYFPPGKWRDHWTGEIHQGPKTLPSYPAPLDRLPFFNRLDGGEEIQPRNQKGNQ